MGVKATRFRAPAQAPEREERGSVPPLLAPHGRRVSRCLFLKARPAVRLSTHVCMCVHNMRDDEARRSTDVESPNVFRLRILEK